MRLALTYDDVLLVPRHSSVFSRKALDTRCSLTKCIVLQIPIISANMDSITESSMAMAMGKLGGLGVIHRFCSIEKQAGEVRTTVKAGFLVGAAVGVQPDDVGRASELVNAGVTVLVVDIAHGDCDRAYLMVSDLKHKHPHIPVIAGNVATPEGAVGLIRAGADCIKIGVGPGSLCETRIVTGVGVPQFTAVLETSSACRANGTPCIADGGCKNSGDVAKALAIGADTVMLGQLLAGTDETPIRHECARDGFVYRCYRGMASREAMDSRGKTGQAPEGVSSWVKAKGPVAVVVDELVSGLRSAMSYLGAHHLSEFKRNAEFVQITQAGVRESGAHGLTVQ